MKTKKINKVRNKMKDQVVIVTGNTLVSISSIALYSFLKYYKFSCSKGGLQTTPLWMVDVRITICNEQKKSTIMKAGVYA